MPPREVSAIILRTRPLGEHDRLVEVVSEEEGVLRAVARGAAKPGNRWGGRLEALGRRTLALAGGRRGLPVLTGSVPRAPTVGLYRDLERMLAAMSVAEAVLALWPEGLAQPRLFRRLDDVLERLALGGPAGLLGAEGTWLLLQGLGEAPDLNHWPAPAEALPGTSLRLWLEDPQGPMPENGAVLEDVVARWAAAAADRPLGGRALLRAVQGGEAEASGSRRQGKDEGWT
ncbi:MAG: DNA repair protein RecO [Candidatus Sericytochromatia bacterium]|nr:DNA repair protein RecO [Candidatus Sericytochromatia bacterium]